MQEWLYNNDVLMYSKVSSESKSVIAERFIKAFKAKFYKNLKANDRKYYISYLDKLVDQ